MRKYVIASLILLLTISCSTKSPLEPEIPNAWPLKVGNNWSYPIHGYDTSGTETGTISVTETIIDKVVIEGEAWYLLEYEINSIPSGIYYMANRRGGCWRRDSVNTTPELVVKYPMSQGDIFEMSGNTVEVISLNETVIVPAGSFQCNHLMETEDIYRIHIYFAPGKGWIEFVYEVANDYDIFHIFQIMELSSIHLE